MTDLLSVAEVAARLRVSDRRVRALIEAGRLPAVKVGSGYVVPRRAVALLATTRRDVGRPLEAKNAWGLLAELAGENPHWVSERSLSRLRKALRDNPQTIEEMLKQAQTRWVEHPLRLLPPDLPTLCDDFPLVLTGLSARSSGVDVPYLPNHDTIEAYLGVDELEAVEKRFRPQHDSERPNVVLRTPNVPWVLKFGQIAPRAVVAADLLLHAEPRVSRAGSRLLRSIIDAYRRP